MLKEFILHFFISMFGIPVCFIGALLLIGYATDWVDNDKDAGTVGCVLTLIFWAFWVSISGLIIYF